MCAFSYAGIFNFCSCDLDFDPMTLIYELDLVIVKMYLRTNIKFGFQKLEMNRRDGQFGC